VTSPEAIRFHVALHYGLSVSDLCGSRRNKRCARPRHVAMYLARSLTRMSYPEIGEFFGGRDHTTVIYAVGLVERLWEEDGAFAANVDFLASQLEAA